MNPLDGYRPIEDKEGKETIEGTQSETLKKVSDLLRQLDKYSPEKRKENGDFSNMSFDGINKYMLQNIDYNNISESKIILQNNVLNYFLEEGYKTIEGDNIVKLVKSISNLSNLKIIAKNGITEKLEFKKGEKIDFIINDSQNIDVIYDDNIILEIINKLGLENQSATYLNIKNNLNNLDGKNLDEITNKVFFKNHEKLLYSYIFIINGLKDGYTLKSGDKLDKLNKFLDNSLKFNISEEGNQSIIREGKKIIFENAGDKVNLTYMGKILGNINLHESNKIMINNFK